MRLALSEISFQAPVITLAILLPEGQEHTVNYFQGQLAALPVSIIIVAISCKRSHVKDYLLGNLVMEIRRLILGRVL